MVAYIGFASRSSRVTLEASKRHYLVYVSIFLKAGGKLDLRHARYHGTVLLLRPDSWSCLIAFQKLLAHGATINKTDKGFDISLPGGRIFELPSDHLVPSSLIVLGQRFLTEEYRDLQVAGSVVIDIGANIGDSAVYFADKGATHVYAFEPFPEPYAAATAVVRRNRLERLVTVIPRGVGSRDGHGIGFYDPMRSDAARATLAGPTKGPAGGVGSSRPEKFDLVSLTSVLDHAHHHYPDRPLVIKFDCEGCEFDSLQAEGIRESLNAVKSILLEVHPDACHSRDSLWRRLEEWGFSVNEINPPTTGGLSLVLATREAHPSSRE